MEEPVLCLREMKLEDLDEVASVHKHCFPGSIFSVLDDRLVKSFYRQSIEEPYSYAVVLEDTTNRRIAGFAVGTMHDGFRKRFLKRHPFICAYSVIKGLFASVFIWKAVITRVFLINKIFKEKTKSKFSDGDSIPLSNGHEAMFMPIAVHSDYRGGGNAFKIAKYLTGQLFNAGAARLRGKIAFDNIASQKLFIKLGWNLKQTEDGWVIMWIDRPEKTAQKEPA